MARRPKTMPPSASTTTAAATFGSRQRTYPSFGHTSSACPSMVCKTSGAPQLTQKCATRWTLDRFGLWPRRARLGRRTLHVGDADLVATALLGRIERLVRAVDQLCEQRRVVGRRDADADGELQSARKSRSGNLRANAFRKGVCARFSRLVEDQRELLPAVPRANVGLAGAGDQDLGQFRQHRIAVQVPIRVVDLFEVVDVDHQERDRIVVAAGSLHLLQEPLREVPPVGQLGELVGEGVLLLAWKSWAWRMAIAAWEATPFRRSAWSSDSSRHALR